MSRSLLEIKVKVLLVSALLTATACLSNNCDAANVSIHSVAGAAGAAGRVALGTGAETVAADTVDEECSLRTWYTDISAAGLLRGAHRREEKASFQSNVDEMLSADDDVMMSCTELESHYNELISWRDEELEEKPRAGQLDSLSVSHINESRGWFSTVDGCSLTGSHSYTACYYVAICQRVCMYHISQDTDQRDDDDAITRQRSERDDDQPEPSSHKDIIVDNQTNLTTTNNSSNQRESASSGSHDVQVNSSLSTAATATSSKANNATQKLSTTKKSKGRETATKAVRTAMTTKAPTIRDIKSTPAPISKKMTTSSTTTATPTASSSTSGPVSKTETATTTTMRTTNEIPNVNSNASIDSNVTQNANVSLSNATQSTTTKAKGRETSTEGVRTTMTTKAPSIRDSIRSTPAPVSKRTTTRSSTTTTVRTTSPSTDEIPNVKSNVSTVSNMTHNVTSSTAKLNNTKEPDFLVKSNTSINNDTTQKPIISNSTSAANATSGKTETKLSAEESDLSQRDETDLESSTGDAMKETAADDRTMVRSREHTDEALKEDSVRASNQESRVDEEEENQEQLRQMEMKMLQLENQLLQSAVDRASSISSAAQLENYIMRLEHELMRLNYSFVELKAENEHLRQRNAEAAAATKNDSSALASVGNQARKLAELIDFVNNQSNFLVALQDKYADLERSNRLLIEQVLNQSLLMNQIMLHVDTLGREQMKHTTQLTELKQRRSADTEGWRSSATSKDRQPLSDHAQIFPDPLNYKSIYDDTPKDCYDHYGSGQHDDAVFTVRPAQPLNDADISVFCDMTDHGWTLIQRRLDGSENFYRSWNDYKVGFGSVDGEHWLGNELIHLLTNQDDYSLRVSLTDWTDVTHVVDYAQFRLTDEADGYRLYAAGYSERRDPDDGSTAGDSLIKHNGCRFSTFDVDNDQVERDFEHGSCARRFTGAWWYYKCYMSNLNGRYYQDGVVPDRLFDGVAWKSWTGSRYSLKRVEMKIRPSRAGQR